MIVALLIEWLFCSSWKRCFDYVSGIDNSEKVTWVLLSFTDPHLQVGHRLENNTSCSKRILIWLCACMCACTYCMRVHVCMPCISHALRIPHYSLWHICRCSYGMMASSMCANHARQHAWVCAVGMLFLLQNIYLRYLRSGNVQGVQRTLWSEWQPLAVAAGLSVVWLPLDPALRYADECILP